MNDPTGLLICFGVMIYAAIGFYHLVANGGSGIGSLLWAFQWTTSILDVIRQADPADAATIQVLETRLAQIEQVLQQIQNQPQPVRPTPPTPPAPTQT